MEAVVKFNLKETLKTGAYAGLLSATLNVSLFFIFRVMDILSDSIVIYRGQPLTAPAVFIESFILSILGSIVLFLLLRYTRNGMYIFSILTIIVVLVSLPEPFMRVENLTLVYGVALDMMHVLIAVILYHYHKSALEEF